MTTTIICVIYTFLGVILETNGVITNPAAWALYGATFGIIISRTMS